MNNADNNEIKRLVVLELILPVGGTSKTRAKQSLAQILNRYHDTFAFENKDFAIKTITLPIMDIAKKFHGPFLKVIFDSNTDYDVSDRIDISKQIEILNKRLPKDIDELFNTSAPIKKSLIVNKIKKVIKWFGKK